MAFSMRRHSENLHCRARGSMVRVSWSLVVVKMRSMSPKCLIEMGPGTSSSLSVLYATMFSRLCTFHRPSMLRTMCLGSSLMLWAILIASWRSAAGLVWEGAQPQGSVLSLGSRNPSSIRNSTVSRGYR